MRRVPNQFFMGYFTSDFVRWIACRVAEKVREDKLRALGPGMSRWIWPEALDSSSEWSYLISFLPGLKSAGGTESILRNTIGERVLGLPPEPRLDKGVPFSELRAKEKAGVTG